MDFKNIDGMLVIFDKQELQKGLSQIKFDDREFYGSDVNGET